MNKVLLLILQKDTLIHLVSSLLTLIVKNTYEREQNILR